MLQLSLIKQVPNLGIKVMAMDLVGQKIGMTRLISDNGSIIPVSVIKIEPNRIVQTRTIDIDGYRAIQVTTGKK